MKKVLSVLFLVFYLFTLFLFIFKYEVFNLNNQEDYLDYEKSLNNDIENDSRIRTRYIQSGYNWMNFWIREETTNQDNSIYFNVKNVVSGENYSLGSIWSIPYDESIYGESYDQTNPNTWTSDPVPTDPSQYWWKRWEFLIPGVIENVGNDGSDVNCDFLVEPGSEYVVTIKLDGSKDNRHNQSFVVFTKPELIELYYGDNFGQISEINFDSNTGQQYISINTEINQNSYFFIEDGSNNFWDNNNLDIKYQIIDGSNNVLSEFDYAQSIIWNPTEPLFQGYYTDYKLRVSYKNGSYNSSTDTLERSVIDFVIHDKDNENGFVVFSDLYVDFSEPPVINSIEYDKIRFSFLLHNETSINLEGKVFITDSNQVFYKSTLLSDNYGGTYDGRLEYEIYDLDYKEDYEIYLYIDKVSDEFDFSYRKNLFLNEKITTADKYPNLMIINYILILLILIFLSITAYYLFLIFKPN